MLQLNGIQHFAFCKRQWALITLENQWNDNEHTIIGQYVHKNFDDPYMEEKRKNKIIVRAMPIVSLSLGFTGICDVVEFTKSKDGVSLKKHDGLWNINVVEYKKGRPKKTKIDIYQAVAQVICLEEMYNTTIRNASVYYKETNKRIHIDVDKFLKDEVIDMSREMHALYKKGETPKAEKGKNCLKCSLKEICHPRLTTHKKSVINYINKYLEDL